MMVDENYVEKPHHLCVDPINYYGNIKLIFSIYIHYFNCVDDLLV